MKKHLSMPLVCFTFFILLSTSGFAQQGSSFWETGGNDNTSGQFIGTLSNEVLIFKTNDTQRLLIGGGGEFYFPAFAGSGPGFVTFDPDGKLVPKTLSGISDLLGWGLNGNGQIYNPASTFVGIGTSDPLEMLHVQGNIYNDGYLLTRGISIIGRAEGERLVMDTMQTEIMMMDSTRRIEGETRIVGKASVSDRFGIGTKYPTEALEIVGNSKISGTISSSQLTTNDVKIGSLSSSNSGQPLTTDPTGKIGPMSVQILQGLVYSIGVPKNCGSGTETMAWVSSGHNTFVDMPACGRVGIGTTAPQHTLEVVGLQKIDGKLGIGVTPTHPLDVVGTAFINGQMGIGTATPLTKLHVEGTTLLNFQGSQRGTLTLSAPYTSGNITAIDFLSGTGANPSARIAAYHTGSGSKLIFGTSNNYTTGITNGELILSETGNVGIGDFDPISKVSVVSNDLNQYAAKIQNGTGSKGLLIKTTGAAGGAGLLVIDGSGNEAFKVNNTDHKCYAKEIVITLQSPFPDYVFEKNYKLMPLADVEQYVSKNKHLPGVVSASEVSSGGLELAKMQATQMEKIEELTLYVIEQNKQIEILRQELKRIKREPK